MAKKKKVAKKKLSKKVKKKSKAVKKVAKKAKAKVRSKNKISRSSSTGDTKDAAVAWVHLPHVRELLGTLEILVNKLNDLINVSLNASLPVEVEQVGLQKAEIKVDGELLEKDTTVSNVQVPVDKAIDNRWDQPVDNLFDLPEPQLSDDGTVKSVVVWNLDDVKDNLKRVSAIAGLPTVKEILQSFGALKVSDVKEKHFAPLIEKCEVHLTTPT